MNSYMLINKLRALKKMFKQYLFVYLTMLITIVVVIFNKHMIVLFLDQFPFSRWIPFIFPWILGFHKIVLYRKPVYRVSYTTLFYTYNTRAFAVNLKIQYIICLLKNIILSVITTCFFHMTSSESSSFLLWISFWILYFELLDMFSWIKYNNNISYLIIFPVFLLMLVLPCFPIAGIIVLLCLNAILFWYITVKLEINMFKYTSFLKEADHQFAVASRNNIAEMTQMALDYQSRKKRIIHLQNFTLTQNNAIPLLMMIQTLQRGVRMFIFAIFPVLLAILIRFFPIDNIITFDLETERLGISMLVLGSFSIVDAIFFDEIKNINIKKKNGFFIPVHPLKLIILQSIFPFIIFLLLLSVIGFVLQINIIYASLFFICYFLFFLLKVTLYSFFPSRTRLLNLLKIITSAIAVVLLILCFM